MKTLKLAVVPAFAALIWIALAASVVVKLESMTRSTQAQRAVPEAAAMLTAGR